MAVSVVAVGAIADASFTSTTSPAIPTGTAAGDVLVCFTFARIPASTVMASTWTMVVQELNTNLASTISWKVATGSDSSPTITPPGSSTTSNAHSSFIIAFRGVNTSTPFSNLGTSNWNSVLQDVGPIVAPSATTTGGACVVIAMKGGLATSVATLTGDGLTWVERVDHPYDTPGGADITTMCDTAVWTGAPPTLTNKTFVVTGGTTGYGLGRMLLLAPAPDVVVDSGINKIISYDNFLLGQMNGLANAIVDFDTDVIKVALVTSTYSPNAAANSFFSDVVNQVTGTNYPTGGTTLSNVSVSMICGNIFFGANDVVWLKSSSGFSNARYAVIYKYTGTNTTSRLIGYLDFGSNVGNVNNDLILKWDPSFIMKFRVKQDRARPTIVNGTVKTDNSKNIRGATMQIVSDATVANDRAKWIALRVYGINTVRMDVKTYQNKRSIEDNLKFLDNAVECASAENMYIMITNSSVGQTYSMMELTDFWSKIAKRYKDRTHVFYEISSEPIGGSPYNGSSSNWTASILQDFNNLHQLIRTAAPDTLIVDFSTTNLHPTPDAWTDLISNYVAYGFIDWSNTVVGYHHYQGTMLFGGRYGVDGINALKTSYPVLMTETNNWLTGFTDIPSDLFSAYEENDLSWFTLDGIDGTNTHVTAIIDDLHAAGYDWPIDSYVVGAPPIGGDPDVLD